MSAFKPVEAYACSMLAVLGSRMEEHQKAHAGAKPRGFILHEASINELHREMRERFGVVEKTLFHADPFGFPMMPPKMYPSFMGVIIGCCPVNTMECGDQYIDANGAPQPL